MLAEPQAVGVRSHFEFEVHISSTAAGLVWLSLTRFCCHNWSLAKVTWSNWATYGHLDVK